MDSQRPVSPEHATTLQRYAFAAGVAMLLSIVFGSRARSRPSAEPGGARASSPRSRSRTRARCIRGRGFQLATREVGGWCRQEENGCNRSENGEQETEFQFNYSRCLSPSDASTFRSGAELGGRTLRSNGWRSP